MRTYTCITESTQYGYSSVTVKADDAGQAARIALGCVHLCQGSLHSDNFVDVEGRNHLAQSYAAEKWSQPEPGPEWLNYTNKKYTNEGDDDNVEIWVKPAHVDPLADVDTFRKLVHKWTQ